MPNNFDIQPSIHLRRVAAGIWRGWSLSELALGERRGHTPDKSAVHHIRTSKGEFRVG